MILFFCAVLTAGVIVAVTRPLSRAGNAMPDINPDVEAFKAQLSEFDREQERGYASVKKEAEQLRIEISRRMLRANRQSQSSARQGRCLATVRKHNFYRFGGLHRHRKLLTLHNLR